MVLSPGYRSVPLKNSYSEDLELAALLIHIEIINAKAGGLGGSLNPITQFPQHPVHSTNLIPLCWHRRKMRRTSTRPSSSYGTAQASSPARSPATSAPTAATPVTSSVSMSYGQPRSGSWSSPKSATASECPFPMLWVAPFRRVPKATTLLSTRLMEKKKRDRQMVTKRS